MKWSLTLAVLVLAAPAHAASIDRGIVEEGTDDSKDDGATSSGVLLVRNNGTTRLRPATCAANSCTRSAPTVATEGLSIEEVVSWRVVVCAPAGHTLSGTGQLELWLRDPIISQWAPMKGKHLTITETAAQCQSFPVEPNDMGGAGFRALYRANGIGITGAPGTGSLSVSLQACKAGSGQMPFRGAGCGP
jgi:hypothetical protein